MADRKQEAYCGDKYVLKISAVYWSPNLGNRYFVEGWDNRVLTDEELLALEKCEEPPKEVPHSCEFCVYQDIDSDCYPCSRCDKNDEPKDMFEAKLKYGK